MTTAALSPGYLAARERTALIRRTSGLIAVSGRDRATYLQGLLTNDIAALAPGHGCYSAYLTAQGRMITDLYVYEVGDAMLVVTPPQTKDTVLAKLDQFIFAEDVQLGDVTDALGVVALVGPQAAAVAARATGLDVEALQALPDDGVVRHVVDGQPVVVMRVSDTGAPGLQIVAPRASLDAWIERWASDGVPLLDESTADLLRIEAGVPRFGPDMAEDTIPLEAGIEARAISFTKGCYVGQEVIIRVLHRGGGRVAQKLVGLTWPADAAVPAAGAALQHDGKDVGAVTSSARSEALGCPIALAYLKRDYLEPGTTVTGPDGRVATVVALPFVARPA